MSEGKYKKHVTDTLSEMFPGCIILKPDAAYSQGLPDLIILWNDRWAALEVKLSANANIQPNQEHFVYRLDIMSFAAFIYPENEEAILHALEQAFAPRRRTRIS